MSHNGVVLGYFISISLILQLLFVASPIEGLEVGTDRSLADSNASFLGEDDLDQAGSGISGVGDVNGDGFDDFLIGAVGDDDGGYYAGQTYLIFGNASGWAMDTDLSDADASFWGEERYTMTGQSLSGAGDVNGDGFDDFLIGAWEEDGRNAGHTYLILGKATGWAMDTSLSDADASFLGEDSDDLSSISISEAGDVNGDGYDDFIIGAYRDEDGGDDAGQTYLILGKASGWAMDTDLSAADASFWGEDSEDLSGSAVSGAGDVNGDGFDDIIIGAPGNDDGGAYAGQTYLILGKASGWMMDTDLSTADASFLGEGDNNIAGYKISGAGDVNGDGFDDILIGANSDEDGRPSAGQTYMILGKASGWAMDTGLSAANASYHGEEVDDYSGSAVSGAGDVNGDGFDDFLIGASGNDEGGSRAGQSYLILGKASGWAMDTNLSTAGASFWGEHADDRSGSRVSGAGDVNGDGFDDILIGAVGNDDGGDRAGQTYLIFPDHNEYSNSIDNLSLHRKGDLVNSTSHAYMNETIHVKLTCKDPDETHINIALVRISSFINGIPQLTLRLRETSMNTGVFIGNFTSKERTHEGYRWIGAEVGDRIRVDTIRPGVANRTLFIINIPAFKDDLPSVMYALEDELFDIWDEDIIIDGGSVATWPFTKSSDWIRNSKDWHHYGGTPNNGDVGTHWLNLTYLNILLDGDWWNVTIIVNNTPPSILTTDVREVEEDSAYLVDYDSDDDGQGTITWHLDTAATWLEINETTGVLSGVPTYLDAGVADISVSVDDGNGGWDFRNFTIEVIDIVDIPIIITEELPDATEEEYYTFQLEVYDPDYMDFSTWSIGTNATWLEIGYETGLLLGTPGNEDVGEWIVGIIVTDSYFLQSSVYLTLNVLNVNDPPTITTEDRTSSLEDVEYRIDYEATDPDVGDVLTWSLETDAGWLDIDEGTGVLSGTPTNDDLGSYFVNVTVSDGEGGSASHEFKLEVIEVNDPPEIVTDLPPMIEVLEDETFLLTLTGEDEEGDDLTWSDDSDLFDIIPTDGTISFLPTQSEVGEWWVNITVEDSGGLTDGVLIRFVVQNVNDPPIIAEARCNGELFDQLTEYVYLRKGKNDSFWVMAIDEDGDDLEYYWVHDGEIVARGNELRYGDLEDGFYLNLTLVVDDGEATSEYTIFKTWVSSEEDEGTSTQLWMLLLLVVAISFVLAVILVRRSMDQGL